MTSIPSVPYAEAALLFHRAPKVERTGGDVARALYMPEHQAGELLKALCEAGILEFRPDPPQRYAYAPRDGMLAIAMDRFSAAYATDMIEMTNLIHGLAGKNAHRFANAFKLRKDR